MKLIDMHCDTTWKLEKADRASLDGRTHIESLYKNTGHIDIEGMKKAGTWVQFFANFIYIDWYEHDYEKGYTAGLSMIDRTISEVEAAKEHMQIVTSYEELQKVQDKIAVFLTVEEGGILNGKMERLHELYQKGIRLMTLSWNYENCMGFPACDDPELMKKGLKPFGIEVVQEMNRLGMLVDVSHMSDGGFWDVIKYSKEPVVASHSNARVICPVRRNMTDEMFKALANKGGVSGVNFYPYFVKSDGVCTADDIARHVKHMISVGGEDLPAVGTDFDGYDRGESEINHVGQMELFYHACEKAGLSERQIDKVCCENALRVIKGTR